jgi:hypothetical protein
LPIKFEKLYTKELLRAHPDWLFVFGDNYERKGLGGQAKVCRGEPNTIGWATKKAPNNLPASYLTDEDMVDWLVNCSEDVAVISAALRQLRVVVFPEDGIGTGLAKLPEKAPAITAVINNAIGSWVERYGMVK